MMVFIDESGDVWFKEASSDYFSVALVIFSQDEDMYSFKEKMIELRKSLKMRPQDEFHYSHLPKKTKYEFVKVISDCQIWVSWNSDTKKEINSELN